MKRPARDVVGRFRAPSPSLRAYLHVRWRVCPFDRVLEHVPEDGRLLDVGCGSGLWLTYLALERPRLRLEGVDPDARKLALAATSSRSADFALHQGVVSDLAGRNYDCVTILDVLYLMPDEEKRAVLRAACDALAPGGTLLVKELDTRPTWKFAPAALEEILAVRIVGLTHGDRLHFQPVEGLARDATRCGFAEVDVTRVDRGYLHPHVLVRARKGGALDEEP